MDTETISITETILQTINTLFSNIFSSIDTNLYSVLDNITFIRPNILDTTEFHSLFGTSSSSGILLIANALIVGFLLYYGINLLLSHLGITQTATPLSFLFKLIFFGICMNSSFFLCEQLLFLISIFTDAIHELGESIFHTQICFSSLIDQLNSIILMEENSLNIFSIDGILKSILSISFLNLTFSYAIRYILVKVFILLSPFAFICLCLPHTNTFFKAWFKCFLSLLFVQLLVSLVLLLIFSLDFNSYSLLSKILLCGSVFVLLKANSYVREMLGGITTELQSGISSLGSFLKS